MEPCSSSISVAVINYFNQKQVREGRGSFQFPDHSPLLRQGTQAGTRRQACLLFDKASPLPRMSLHGQGSSAGTLEDGVFSLSEGHNH